MTIAATRSKIITMAAASSGIASAPTGLPSQLDNEHLPCAIVIVGPAQWNEHAVGLYRQVRTYEVRTLVTPVALGATLDEGYSKCVAPLYAMGRTFVEDGTLGGTVDMIGDRGDFADGGVQVLTWAGTDYHGFVITLRVTEKST